MIQYFVTKTQEYVLTLEDDGNTIKKGMLSIENFKKKLKIKEEDILNGWYDEKGNYLGLLL
jgi:hypothetical protein